MRGFCFGLLVIALLAAPAFADHCPAGGCRGDGPLAGARPVRKVVRYVATEVRPVRRAVRFVAERKPVRRALRFVFRVDR